MKKIINCLIALAVFTTANAQSTVYDDKAVKRPIGTFHAIQASTGIQVLIAHGEMEELAVSASTDALAKKVRTEVVDGTLKIYMEDGWKFWETSGNNKVKAYVSYRQLDKLTATSGASIKGDINAAKLFAKQSSGGQVELKGSVERLEADASSGGIFKGYELQVAYLVADASSGGGIQAQVEKEVNASASSGGFVKYKGGAIIRDINVSSGGSVKRIDQ